MNEKPPLGLTPIDIYNYTVDRNRAYQIIYAIKRYSEHKKSIPKEWIEELEMRFGNIIQQLPNWR